MPGTSKIVGRAGAAIVAVCATAAQAQVSPAIQINFNGAAPVPLSPVAIAIVALAVAAIAVAVLRRSRRAGTIAGLALAAAVTAVAPGSARLVEDAHAGTAAIPLVTSPTVYTISAQGTYLFQNALQTPISLTLVTLNNPSGFQINTSASSCAPAVVLAPNATCSVVVFLNAG